MMSFKMVVEITWNLMALQELTHKQLEIYGCVISTLATDALVLQHQVISTHSSDQIFSVLNQFHAKILHLYGITVENNITIWKKKYIVV